jgi:hypothetical protein
VLGDMFRLVDFFTRLQNLLGRQTADILTHGWSSSHHMRQPPHASAIARFNERIKTLTGFDSDSNSRGEEFLAEGFPADGRAQVQLETDGGLFLSSSQTGLSASKIWKGRRASHACTVHPSRTEIND